MQDFCALQKGNVYKEVKTFSAIAVCGRSAEKKTFLQPAGRKGTERIFFDIFVVAALIREQAAPHSFASQNKQQREHS